MGTLLTIWCVGLIVFSLILNMCFRNDKEDKPSFAGTLFILIFWPLTFVTVCFLLIITWIEDKSNKDTYIHIVIENKKEDNQ